jgi:hypothetical protein
MLALTMTQNKSGVFTLSAYQSDGATPQSLVNMVLWFHAAFGTFAIDKHSPSSGISISNTAGGLNCASLQIDPTDTAALKLGPNSVVQMHCELSLQNGAQSYQLDQGTLTVTGNVGAP